MLRHASRVVKIFIDYNNNGTFTDPGEEVATKSGSGWRSNITFSGNLVYPAGMTVGNSTRMRIVAEETTDTTYCSTLRQLWQWRDAGLYSNFYCSANDVSVSAVVDPLPGILPGRFPKGFYKNKKFRHCFAGQRSHFI